MGSGLICLCSGWPPLCRGRRQVTAKAKVPLRGKALLPGRWHQHHPSAGLSSAHCVLGGPASSLCITEQGQTLRTEQSGSAAQEGPCSALPLTLQHSCGIFPAEFRALWMGDDAQSWCGNSHHQGMPLWWSSKAGGGGGAHFSSPFLSLVCNFGYHSVTEWGK